MALGAGRWRIIRQLLIESVLLSAIGGVFAWLIAAWGVSPQTYAQAAFAAFNSPPAWFDFSVDYRVLGYLAAISIGTGLLFGLGPAIRLSKLDVSDRLKDGGRGASGGWRGKRLSGILVIGEVALAVVLLAGAGVTIRSFLNMYTADLGVNAGNIVTMSLSLPDTRYPIAETKISFFERLKMRLEALPGVESVVLASALPTARGRTRAYELAEGSRSGANRPTVSSLTISPAYFRTLGAAVLSGRDFNDADGVSGVRAVIVNERFAAAAWPGEDPIGKRLRLFDGTAPQAWLTVVGVVSNIVQDDLTWQRFDPLLYVPYLEDPVAGMSVIARTRVAPGSFAIAFLREIQSMDPDLPFGMPPSTLSETLERQYTYRLNQIMGGLFLIFSTIALLLASIGLYAIIAHSVGQRTQEIGIRMALGATARDILKLVLKQGMLAVGIGLTIGLAASLAVNRLLEGELVEVSPTDPTTLIAASAALILSAMLGCWIPARRAMGVDPVVAIRHE